MDVIENRPTSLISQSPRLRFDRGARPNLPFAHNARRAMDEANATAAKCGGVERSMRCP